MAAIELTSLTFGTINSVAEMINWSEHFAGRQPGEVVRTWAFRGQPAEYMNLKPSYPRTLAIGSAGAAEIMERDLIGEFRRHYATLPDRNQHMPAPETIETGADIRCLSVMQHYEVPTRLLDWTTNFWTAIYFACASDPGNNGELWLYDRAIFAPQLRKHPELHSLLQSSASTKPEPNLLWERDLRLLLEFDHQSTARMKQQFAHHTVATNVSDDHANLLADLATQAKEAKEDAWYFRRFLIDKGCKGNALKFLKEHRNVTASTVFPDVVGLGRFLRWHFESLKTMFE